MKTSTLSRSAQFKLIHKLFNSFPPLLIGWGKEAKDELYDQHLAAERHRRKYYGVPKDFPASLAAKYFTVQATCELMVGKRKAPDPKEYLHIKKEIFYTWGVIHEKDNRDILLKWMQKNKEDLKEFWLIEYVNLRNPDDPQQPKEEFPESF